MRKYFARLEHCLVGMEACGGAHFWSRENALPMLARHLLAELKAEHDQLRVKPR